VEVAFEKKFENPVLLSEIRKIPELSGMRLLQKGNRLSITPVEA
jgi:predicted RNA-binding protein with PUA-like domain